MSEGWELARNNFRLVERRPHSSSEDCEINTQHNQLTFLFEITYTLLTLLVFFGILCILGFPGVPGQTAGVRPGPDCTSCNLNCESGMTHPF